MRIFAVLAILVGSLFCFSKPVFAKAKKATTPSLSFFPERIEKPSLQKLGKALKYGPQITELYKETQGYVAVPEDFPVTEVERLWKANTKTMEKLQGAANSSTPFVRGEIDNEEVLNNTLTAVQLSLLRARLFAVRGDFYQVKDEIASWFIFAADLPYEEASLISLRLANLIRSLLLDELEAVQKKWPEKLVKDGLWLHWARGLRAPWPIDRVILSESKRLLKPKMIITAERVAKALQKNTYQTAAAVLEKTGGAKTTEFDFIKQMWRAQDIEAMKTEINRLNEFRIRLAALTYEQQNKKKATHIDELVGAKLLNAVPINYQTGKPFGLDFLMNQAASH